ncbi:hypothetical protein [Alicyclobacillus sp. SO9]|uniref:hypothetical protein n=1 Tax=Alicyclobacillus sp. SO9 TaxID=2665646 RepID=UPI0018E7997F|nr:hypothetical protein [Alicyclobacillus sp. SO9]QQE78729.1 hypothetical protein GI364_23250 [Alicyclobacillus sp. SO9]
MATRTYYYFCDSCGGDTATYELVSACPYCHARKPSFTLVDESAEGWSSKQIEQQVEMLRSRWLSKSGNHTLGVPKRKGFSLFRRRG